ncbi:MAG: hypothetical protein R2940_11640 [Syntrophotaleaceae bacterium]
MPDTVDRNQVLRLDLKLLTKFIYELNIARHHSLSYPTGHPLIRASIDRALDLLQQLSPERESFSIGITSDSLWYGSTPLDQKNPVFRDFAHHLFSRGGALITFQAALTARELEIFFAVLANTREEILEQGGLQQTLKAAGIVHLSLQQIDYGRFRPIRKTQISPGSQETGKRHSVLWERFVRELLDDQAGHSVESPVDTVSPETLAEILNQKGEPQARKTLGHYEQAITEFLREMDREKLDEEVCTPAINRLKILAANLNPEFRFQLMNSTFRELDKRPDTAARFLQHFPAGMLLEALENLNNRREAVPPVIFKLLSHLTLQKTDLKHFSGSTTAAGIIQDSDLEPLFMPDQTIAYSTEEYRGMLKSLDGAAAPAVPAAPPVSVNLDDPEFDANIEKKTCEIIFHLSTGIQVGEESGFLWETLLQLWDHLLGIGDFNTLADIYQKSLNTGSDFFTTLHRPEALNEVLDSPNHWGKEKFAEIQRLVVTIGSPVVKPLLDRLATESKRSLRYFLIDCLVELGETARPEILARLKDQRWYYLRNLLTVLRRQGDPSVMPEVLLHLRQNPNEIVHQELLKTAIGLSHAEMDQLLLEDLAHPLIQRQLGAVRLAPHSRHPQVFQSLLRFLQIRDLSDAGFRQKIASVRALAEMNNTAALPDLERLYSRRSLLHPRRQRLLQTIILENLRHYSGQDAALLYRKLGGKNWQKD